MGGSMSQVWYQGTLGKSQVPMQVMSAQVGIPTLLPRPCLVFSLSYYPYFTIYTSISVYNLICTDPASLCWRTAQTSTTWTCQFYAKRIYKTIWYALSQHSYPGTLDKATVLVVVVLVMRILLVLLWNPNNCQVITPGIATTSGITISITLHILGEKSYPGMLEKATPLVVVVLPLLVM